MRRHLPAALVLLGYALLVLTGTTTSSIGIGHLRQDPAAPLGTQVGDPSWIRSDEYNAFTPIDLSIMATGGAPTLSALGERADVVHRFPSDGPLETLVYFDATLLRAATVLPDAMVFAAHWWLPVVVLLLALPRWFRQTGHSGRLGWLAGLLVVLSPSVAWWSMQPVQLLAWTVAGSSLLLTAAERWAQGSRVLAALAAAGSGLLLAGLPSAYIPWALVLGLPVLVASVLHVLTAPGRTWATRVVPVAAAGLVAAVLGLGTLWENRAGLQALLGTVYPGSRRSAGEAQPLGMLLGAPGLGALQDGDPVGTNASELSSSFTVAFVWALVLLAGGAAASLRLRREALPAVVVGVSGLALLAWCTVSTGTPGEHVPLLNRITAPRAAQVVGVLGVLLVAMLLSRLPRPSWALAGLSALACGGVTAYAVSSLRATSLPQTSLAGVALAALGVAVVVLAVSRAPHRTWPVVLAAALALVPVARANPVLVGLGDLRASSSARYLAQAGDAARAAGQVWASDSVAIDVVMLANGVPSLSGLQRSGPDRQQWERLDPSGTFRSSWNRGGGYLPFAFREGGPLEITDNGFDSTVVTVDPCALAATFPELSHVVSGQAFTGPCLTAERTLLWGGVEHTVYRVG
ncbi:DUF7657 domain-containing protein [Cellulomonas endophytica]|uniref:DUF7657 domain-containing protein n=1 Tax=Cellulomonas endophytica TaxID=2494735 RepID=UPI0010109EF9|nr:hypothetical protein [Cellulomonas endophytica]